MGNLLSEQIYIVGEVDYRVVRLDQPFWRASNLCLRYPTFSTMKPSMVTVNYDQPVNCQYLFVSNIDQINQNGSQLRQEGKTTIVMVEGYRNLVTGSLSDYQIIASEIVPMTKSYARK